MKTAERISLSAFVDPGDYKRLAEHARSQDRSMSAVVRMAIREHLDRRADHRHLREPSDRAER